MRIAAQSSLRVTRVRAPTLEKVIAAEAGLDREALIEQAWTSRFSVLVEQFEK